MLSACVSWAAAGAAWQRRESQTARVLVALLIACGFWPFAAGMRISHSDLLWQLSWLRLTWISMLLLPLLWFSFILRFIGYGRWFTRRRVVLLVVPLLIFYALVLTNESHHLVSVQFEPNVIAGLRVYYAVPGGLYYLITFYCYALAMVGLVLLARTIWRIPPQKRQPYNVVLLAGLVPAVGYILQLAFHLSKLLNITSILFAVTGSAYLWAIFGHQLLEIGTIARNRVIDSLPDGMIVVDQNLRIADLNPGAYRFIGMGLDRSMLIGNPIRDVLPLWMQELWTLYLSPATIKQTLKVDMGGQPGYVAVQMYPIHEALSSEMLGWVLNLRDVTVEQQMQIEREHLREQQMEVRLEKERIHLLTHFIRDAAQEFSTPLTIMNSSAFLLERIVDRDKRIQKARSIQEQVQRMITLVDTLLKMVNLEGEPTQRWIPVNMGLLVDNLCQNAIHTGGERSALDWLPPPDVLCVCGNPEQLADVVSQILDNAYRFTPPDGKITVRMVAQDHQVCIHIQDTGIGISAADLPHIFEMFWRKDMLHPEASFGLGLAVAQKIVSLHQGKIEVYSEVGQGSQFRVILPQRVESEVMKPARPYGDICQS